MRRVSAYYRPQTKFAKVMFLHVSVSHSVQGGGRVGVCLLGWGCLLWGGVCSQGGLLLGVVPALGGTSAHRGVPAPGVSAPGGSAPGGAWSWGSCPRGVCGGPQ